MWYWILCLLLCSTWERRERLSRRDLTGCIGTTVSCIHREKGSGTPSEKGGLEDKLEYGWMADEDRSSYGTAVFHYCSGNYHGPGCLNTLGSLAVAGFAAASKIEQVVTQAYVALGTAMAT